MANQKVAIITVIKNESKRLSEWVDFHFRFHDIDHFEFYLDYPDDDSEEVLNSFKYKYNIHYQYTREIRKEATQWEGHSSPELDAEQEYSFSLGYNKLRPHFDWIIIMDVDEWIVPTNIKEYNLKQTLLQVKENRTHLYHLTFCPPFDTSKSIIEQNFYRWDPAPYVTPAGLAIWPKTIMRGKLDKDCSVSIHWGSESVGKGVECKDFVLHHFQNHMYYKDEEFLTYDDSILKMIRGV